MQLVHIENSKKTLSQPKRILITACLYIFDYRISCRLTMAFIRYMHSCCVYCVLWCSWSLWRSFWNKGSKDDGVEYFWSSSISHIGLGDPHRHVTTPEIQRNFNLQKSTVALTWPCITPYIISRREVQGFREIEGHTSHHMAISQAMWPHFGNYTTCHMVVCLHTDTYMAMWTSDRKLWNGLVFIVLGDFYARWSREGS